MTDQPNRPAILFCLTTIAGAVLSLFTVRLHVLLANQWTTGPSYCNINTAINCDAVATSSYSSFLSLPLGSWGLIFFGSLFILRLAHNGSALLDNFILLLTTAGALGSILLFGISEFLVGSLCLYCIGIYVCCFMLFGISMRAIGAETFLKRLFLGLQAPAGILGRGHLPPIAIGFLVLWIALSVSSPQLLTAALRPAAPTLSEQQLLEKQWFEAWAKAPQHDLPIVSSGPLQDYVQGPSFSPVTIVEFSDFECSACRFFYRGFEPLLEKHAGKFSFVLKNFPLDPSCNPIMRGAGGHAHACLAAVASRCAGEQGKFFEAAQRLFLMPALDHPIAAGVDPASEIRRLDTALHIDPTEFSRCLSAGRAEQKILADIKLGMELNVESTPTIYINGRKIPDFNPVFIEKIIVAGGK